MKVGVLGSGDVGQALGRGFVNRGHDVKLSSRNPKGEAVTTWLSKVKGKASTGTYVEAARHGEVVVLATQGSAAEEVIRTAGVANFKGKLVIDVTNPLAFEGASPGLFVGLTDSLGERIQRLLPDAKVVKAFNTVPNTQMVDPKFAGGAPPMMIAGDDAAAKKQVVGILKEFGWPGSLDLGGIQTARWLEASVMLWVLAGTALGRWDHAFKVVHG
jgi:8-hydroxy-5-deazaflavin:NADPH oxidoreductase